MFHLILADYSCRDSVDLIVTKNVRGMIRKTGNAGIGVKIFGWPTLIVTGQEMFMQLIHEEGSFVTGAVRVVSHPQQESLLKMANQWQCPS